ncbi:hypothetical protein D3C71_2092950 [compost metagenome]
MYVDHIKYRWHFSFFPGSLNADLNIIQRFFLLGQHIYHIYPTAAAQADQKHFHRPETLAFATNGRLGIQLNLVSARIFCFKIEFTAFTY